MDSKYIITPSGNFVSTDELYHWGIKGMRWGIRRYQNADGTLTDQGKKRYLNPDGTLNKKGKKKFGDSVALPKKERPKISEDYLNEQLNGLTDQELMQKVIRLRNEDSYRELSKKLGYGGPKTDIDYQIDELTKQKTYLGLQKDIRDLNNQLNPKKESAVKKIIKTAFEKAIIPAATEAGKDFLKKYLGEQGTKLLEKEAKDTAKKVADSAERVKEKEAKKTKDTIDKNIKKEQEKQKKQTKADIETTSSKDKNGRLYTNKSLNGESSEAERYLRNFIINRRKTEINTGGEEGYTYRHSEGKNRSFYGKVKKMQSEFDFEDPVIKTSLKSLNDKTNTYEKRVDEILKKMDDKAWEKWYKEYSGDY